MEEAIAAMRALWSEEQASFEGTTANFTDCFLRPQPPGGTIPVHVGGHSPAAARRAGRIGDGFFPFGVSPDELPPLIDLVRTSAEEAGRDPSDHRGDHASATRPPARRPVAEVEALQEIGATRILIPAVLFGSDLEPSLAARTART